jgi:Ca2+/Na+ antiporter
MAFSAVLLVVFFYGRATMNRKIAAVLLMSYFGYMSLRAFS